MRIFGLRNSVNQIDDKVYLWGPVNMLDFGSYEDGYSLELNFRQQSINLRNQVIFSTSGLIYRVITDDKQQILKSWFLSGNN